MARRIFVDTANNSKPHLCYDPNEDRFLELNNLAELAGKYDEVYIDSSIFPNMWPQLEALISNGAKVFCLAWPWKWKKMREKYANYLKKRFGKKKTDQGDAYILSRIHGNEPKAFIEVTPLDVEFKPLLVKERRLVDELLRLRQMQISGVDVKDIISVIEEVLLRLRQEIVEKAVKIPFFREVAGKFGLDNDDINGLSALTGLLIYLRWPYKVMSMHKARRYLGLYKPTREDVRKFEEKSGEKYRKRYSGCARRYLSSLTAAILRKERYVFPPRARDEREVLKRLLGILRHIAALSRVEGQDKSPNEACSRGLYAPQGSNGEFSAGEGLSRCPSAGFTG